MKRKKMGRPTIGAAARYVQIGERFSKKEMKLIESAAKMLGQNRCTFIRDAALEKADSVKNEARNG